MINIHDGTRPWEEGKIRVVCMSDSHSTFPVVPPGHIFIHAGDFTNKGYPEEIAAFNDYLGSLQFDHKIVISGNHDTPFDIENFEINKKNYKKFRNVDPRDLKALLTNCVYLEDSMASVFGLHGSSLLNT